MLVGELFEEEDLGVEIVRDALLDHARPILIDKLQLGVIGLDPFGLGRDLPLHLPHLLWHVLARDADQVLNLDQYSPEKAQVVATLAEADHAADHIVLVTLLRRVVHVLQVEVLRDRYECLEHAGSFGLDTPPQVEVVDLRVRVLQQVLVKALMPRMLLLVKHGCRPLPRCLVCRGMRQTVLLLLDELILQCFKELAILVRQVLHVLLLLIHCLVAGEGLRSDVGAGELHSNLIVCLLHLRHIDELAKKILVEIEHVGAFAARAVLDLLVM